MPLNMQAFCDQELWSTRFNMSQPHVINRTRYATDCRIVVCEDAPGEPDTVPTEGRFPDAAGIFAKMWQDNLEFADYPAPDYIDGKVECDECEDIECPDCGGDGSQECDLGHDHGCDKCDGSGVLSNKTCKCKGTGYITGPALQRIGGIHIDVKYDQLIRKELTGVKFAVSGDAVLFTFDGGRGIVMRKKAEGEV